MKVEGFCEYPQIFFKLVNGASDFLLLFLICLNLKLLFEIVDMFLEHSMSLQNHSN